MKRLIVLSLIIALTACGSSGGKAKKTDSAAASAKASAESVVTESKVESVKETTPEPTSTPAPVTIDFDKCYQQMKDEGATELYEFVQDFYVGLQDDGKTIDISVIVDEDADPQKVLEYTHMLIKELNYYAAEQDKSLSAASSDSYGGLYKKYHALVGVATSETQTFLIYDAITFPEQFVSLK